MSAGAEPLAMGDAVELLHAWVQSRAEREGIRVLFIKGPALAHHGLRGPRTSSDVDVLVEPTRFKEFCGLVEQAGWRVRPSTFAADRYSVHSRAYLTDRWPCDLDAHSFNPGFLRPPGEVFDALWARHERLAFAHVDCAVPDRLSSILILALHSLRSSESDARHARELEGMVSSVTLTDDERQQLAALSLLTGSDHTLDTVLPDLGVEVVGASDVDPEAVREWRTRVESGATATYMWLALLRRSRGLEAARTLRHAIWPSRADLALMYPSMQDTRSARLSARVRRLSRGFRALPRATRAAADTLLRRR